MRHVRMLTLCLAAAFAVAALAATSASAALPEWGKCVKLPATIKGVEHKAGTGKFSNSNCNAATTGGEFEFLKGTAELPSRSFKNTMTSTEATLETTLGVQVKCSSEIATGELSGTKEVANVRVTFKGCKANLLELACENNFETFENPATGKTESRYVEGEIFTRALKGKLGYVSGKGTATPKVGLLLEPEEAKGLFTFFGCGFPAGPGQTAQPIIWSLVGEKETGGKGHDGIISPITPVDTMGTETTQVYSIKKIENPETHVLENEKGIQEVTAFEGSTKQEFLESNLFNAFDSIGYAQSAQEETAVTKLESGEELEIKA